MGATDASTRPLRGHLGELGYAVKGWELGRNLGRRRILDDALVPRLRELHAHTGRTVSLVGWGLGGILAREMAKRSPQDVRQVVTMGRPYAGGGRASNVARLFEAVSGRRIVDDPQVRRRIREAHHRSIAAATAWWPGARASNRKGRGRRTSKSEAATAASAATRLPSGR